VENKSDKLTYLHIKVGLNGSILFKMVALMYAHPIQFVILIVFTQPERIADGEMISFSNHLNAKYALNAGI